VGRLLAPLSDEDGWFGELAGIIQTDAVLAGNLLRVVNSPLYGRSSTINSVRHAVAIMGSIKIRNLVLGLSVSRRWDNASVPRQWNSRQFNTHSLAVAVLSDLIALEVPVPYPEGAFTAGLLHDIGKLLIAVAAPESFESLCDVYTDESVNDCEAELVGASHAQISGAILEKWKLPKPIQEAVAYHHSPDEADRHELRLAHVIQAADRYINTVGLGMPPFRHHPVTSIDACDERFGVRDGILKMAEVFREEFETVRAFC